MKLPAMSMRIKNIEVRTCSSALLLNEGDHTTAEVIRWFHEGDKRHCIVLAYWKLGKEGYDLQFVGNRPFQIPWVEFMEAAEFGQKFLDDRFTEEDEP